MTEQERLASLEAREKKLHNDRVRFDLTAALSSAKVRTEALNDTVALMAGAAQFEIGEDGHVAKVIVGDGEALGMDAAVRHFLKARPFLVAQEQQQTDTTSSTPSRATVADITTAFSNPPPARQPMAANVDPSAHSLFVAGFAEAPDAA
jgi:hypothetical protein